MGRISVPNSNQSLQIVHSSKNKELDVYCKTLMCYIVQPNTDFKVAIRILLDSASNQQLVTHQIADFMKLSGPRVHLAMCTTGNDIKTFARE